MREQNDSPYNHVLERRLSQLETANRRHRNIGILLAMALIVVVSVGQTNRPEKVIRAEEFRLVGKDGTTKAEWSSRKSATTISFLDQTGSARAMLGVTDDGLPALTLFDKKQEIRTYIYVSNKDDSPAVKLTAPNQKVPACLSVGEVTCSGSVSTLFFCSSEHEVMRDGAEHHFLFLTRRADRTQAFAQVAFHHAVR